MKYTTENPEEGKVCRKCMTFKPKAELVKKQKYSMGVETLCLMCRSAERRAKYVPKGKGPRWSEEELLSIAKAYDQRMRFLQGNNAAYIAAIRHEKGIDYFCSHMTPANRSWTFEKILEIARTYNSIKEFSNGDYAAYGAGLRTGRTAELYSHMSKRAESVDRFIYVIQSADDTVAYVGLSENPRRRYLEHKRSGRKEVRALIAGQHKFSIILGPISEEEAKVKEAETLGLMAAKGFRMLNAAKPGSLGTVGSEKWTRETVADEALKYNSISALQRGSPGAYGAAWKRLGGIAQFCGHMTFSLRRWDIDSIRAEALKYSSRKEFEDACGSAVGAARRIGIMDDVCSHMPIRRRPPDNDNVLKSEAA